VTIARDLTEEERAMTGPRWKLRYAAVAVAACTVAATAPLGAAAAQSAAPPPGPSARLIVAQNRITVPRFRGRAFIDPGVYVAALGSALQFDVQRASYTQPITITQVIHRPDGSTVTRPLPASLLHGFRGLRNFLSVSVAN
jgi:hypothetical protein